VSAGTEGDKQAGNYAWYNKLDGSVVGMSAFILNVVHAYYSEIATT